MPTKEPDPTPFSRATAREIKSRIDSIGISNAAFARKTGLSPNYLNERLREEKSFTLTDIESIAGYFKQDPAEFMAAVQMPANVGGELDDSYEYDPEPPKKSDHALIAKTGRRKIDQD